MLLPSISQLLLGCLALLQASEAEAAHVLCLFVNVHRSQLLVHSAVAHVLLQRGHQLTLITTLPLEQPLAAAAAARQLRHIQITTNSTGQTAQPSRDDQLNGTRLERLLKRLERSAELLTADSWLSFMAEQPAPRYELLLLGYHFNDHLLGVAAHFDCPAVIVHTQQPTGFVHSLLGSPEQRWHVPQPYDSQQRTGYAACLLGLWEKTMEWLARRSMQQLYEQHFAAAARHTPFAELPRRVVLAFCNHHMLSEGPIAAQLPQLLDIGGIQLEQSALNATLNLHSTRPALLFSLGTRFSWRSAPAQFTSLFLHAFAELPGFDIYWSYDGIDAADMAAEHAHLKLSPWWPQQQLLAAPQLRLFISHVGKGSLSEALYYGVPLLALPLVGDQRVHAQRLVSNGWGLALAPHNLSSELLLATLQQLLQQPAYRANMQRASRLYRDRPLNASALTAYWLDYVLRYRGARHLNYLRREMSPWQYFNVDVYASLYGGLWLVISALRWLDRRLVL